MYLILSIAALVAAGVWIADHVTWLKTDFRRTGIWFGLLGITADLLRYEVDSVNLSVGLSDVPAMVAAFFFSPAAGVTAGVITGLERILPLNGNPDWAWSQGLVTIIAAGYAAAMAQWVFERRRPPVIAASIAAAYGELLHLTFTVLFGLFQHRIAHMLEMLFAAYPLLPVGAAAAAGLSSVACGAWRNWRLRFFNSLTVAMLFLGIAFGVIAHVAEAGALRQTHAAIRAAIRKLKVQFDDQITYSLHGDAQIISKRCSPLRSFSVAEMQKIADDLDVDEINIFGHDGRLVASNRPEVKAYNQTLRSPGALKDFFKLFNGKCKFVKQDFRASRSNPELFAQYVGIPLDGGRAFLQLGCFRDRVEKEFSSLFFPMFNQAVIEDDGCFIVTDAKGTVAAPAAGHPGAEGKNICDLGMSEEMRSCPTGEFFETRLFGTFGQCCRGEDVGPWRIYAFLPYTEFYDKAVIIAIATLLTLFGLCIALQLGLIRLARARKKIDDMQQADLTLASTIQNSELPPEKQEFSGCLIQAKMTPAKEVGGDFYDYYELTDGRVAITVADVSGKGVPAAIFMMKAKNLLKSSVLLNSGLVESVTRANQTLNRNNQAAMFVTVWLGIFNPASGELEYVSAGHNPPLMVRKNGTAEWLRSPLRQKPLAAFSRSHYQTEKAILAPGDRLVLYTDGVTEAQNPKRELFGTRRLEETVLQNPADLVGIISLALECFMAGAPVADDITLLTMEMKK